VKYKVTINVTLKDSILDPQGKTGLHALGALGFQDAKDLRVGKHYVLTIDSANKIEAKKEAEEMCQKLLANPIIEKYFINVDDSEGTANLGGVNQ